MPEDPEQPRSAFLLPRDVTYLNTAYMGPTPRTGVEAAWATADRKARPWTITPDDFFVPVEAYRASIAALLGVDADGVAVTPSAGYGMSTFAPLLPLAPGQVVVVPADEFPSASLPFEAAARAAGGELVRVGPDGRDRTGPLVAEIRRRGDQVAAVSVPPCHWTDGTPFDLATIAASARDVGAAVALDVTQWMGAAPLDLGAISPDLVVGAVYKWLLGPYALGYAWFAPRWRDGTPLEESWLGRDGADDFAALTSPSADYRAGARRFDMGESAQLSLLAAAQAGLDLVTEWRPDATAVHARRLTDRIADGAAALGLGVAPPEQRAPHLLGLGLTGTGLEPATLAAHLADGRVHVSVRGTSVRVAAHRFNTDEDVDRLLAALATAPRKLNVAGTCTFCAIVAGDLPAHVVLDDDAAMAFLDVRPLFPGHVLLVPREHHETLTDLPPDQVEGLFSRARSLAAAVEEATGAKGTFVAMNNRVSQSVPHLHVHVVPRTKGDGLRGFFWPRTKYGSDEQAADVASSIAERLRGQSPGSL